MTETEAFQALAATRLELRQVEKDRDRWKEQAELHKRARRVAVRAQAQADDDADNAWRQCELLAARLEDYELRLSAEEVAFP